MKKIFLLILFYFSVTILFSQITLLDSLNIKNYKEYNNLNEALLNPEKVIVLNVLDLIVLIIYFGYKNQSPLSKSNC